MYLPRAAMAAVILLLVALACTDQEVTSPDREAVSEAGDASLAAMPDNPRMVREGQRIFRFDDFGSWRFWTDTAELNVLVEGLTPNQALGLGLKVDVEAIPPEVLDAVVADPGLLDEEETTLALLSLDAVIGVAAEVEDDEITRIGITCALCHSTVDDQDPSTVLPGVGERRDGWPNRDLQIGVILSELPGLPTIADALGIPAGALGAAFASWPPSFYDARVNLDGRLEDPPPLIPPAYGLRGVGLETYTGEGPISYWNNYVAVTQMRGQGSFFDPKLGVRISVRPQEDEVKKKLPALRQYQFSLEAPPPPPGTFDPEAAERGRAVFEGPAQCADCHVGPRLTDGGRLHGPAETGMEETWAERSTTGQYRTTPLRALWQHPPYFHDGSAPTLEDVVAHYEDVLDLELADPEREDLLEYLRSL